MRKLVLGVLCLCAAAPAFAKDVEIRCPTDPANRARCQAAFDSIAEDLVATIDYKGLAPAEATGLAGFGVGLVATYVPVDVDADWQAVTGQDFSGLGLVGLQVTKGLPLDIDAGVFYTTVPGTNIDIYGGELRYAILAGSTTSPALALRAAYVTVTGVETFDLESTSADIALSKGFGPITPYVGVGYVMGNATPDPSYNLDEAEVEDTKAFIGARLSMGLVELTPEVGQVGDTVTYSARLGFSFSL
jgi:hypothetical protein